MSDTINRDEAIKAINIWVRTPHDIVSAYYADRAEKAVLSVPSADRPQGKWIVNIPNYESVCSVCGASEADFIYGTEMWYGLGESNFCPNCGARMFAKDINVPNKKGADDE